MKKKNFIIVFIFSLFFVANLNSVFAVDPPPCTDCNTGIWEEEELIYTNFQGCPACSIRVWVVFNLDCYELYIKSYQFMNIECSYCRPAWTIEQIFGEIKGKVLLDGPLPLPAGGSSQVYKIRYAACYTYVMNNPISPDPFVPCDDETCCKEEYKIIMSSGGTASTVPVSSERIGDECSEDCYDLCGSPLIPPSPRINVNENQDDGVESIVKSIVYPNPASESAVLEYSCEETGKVLFKIFDVQGNEVYSLEDNKTSESSTLNLDINPLTDGVYYYKLYLNDINISTGSLTIIK